MSCSAGILLSERRFPMTITHTLPTVRRAGVLVLSSTMLAAALATGVPGAAHAVESSPSSTPSPSSVPSSTPSPTVSAPTASPSPSSTEKTPEVSTSPEASPAKSAETPLRMSPDTFSTKEGTRIKIMVLDNDVLQNHDDTVDSLSLVGSDGKSTQRLVTSQGVYDVEGENTKADPLYVSFVPKKSFHGETDRVSYEVTTSDGHSAKTYFSGSVTEEKPETEPSPETEPVATAARKSMLRPHVPSGRKIEAPVKKLDGDYKPDFVSSRQEVLTDDVTASDSCQEVNAKLGGSGNYRKDNPGYSLSRDRDRDGVACEVEKGVASSNTETPRSVTKKSATESVSVPVAQKSLREDNTSSQSQRKPEVKAGGTEQAKPEMRTVIETGFVSQDVSETQRGGVTGWALLVPAVLFGVAALVRRSKRVGV